MTNSSDEHIESPATQQESSKKISQRPRRLSTRVMIVVRRVHLYSGLFLLPWVFLYGITGAMFNHQELFPEASFAAVDTDSISNYSMNSFPSPESLAQQVVEALQLQSDSTTVELSEDHGAEFTNLILFERNTPEGRQVVRLHPISKQAEIVNYPKEEEVAEPVMGQLPNLKLQPDPHWMAQNAATEILKNEAGKELGSPKPLGWTKLNFLANVDGEPARVTYVLKDGHVDVTRFEGEDGFSLRRFFLRLHTSHGQPPHWNARFCWSLIVDVMAFAMVTWGLSGIFMWWQIKRTRWIGATVILLSLCSAFVLYLSMTNFYSLTKL